MVAVTTSNRVPSYRELVTQASELLYETSDTPRIDAEVLMQHCVGKNMAWLIAYGDSSADAGHIKDFFSLVEQRQKGQPIAYLLGYKEFWSMKLEVNEHVLIPRADSETLVECALAHLQDQASLTQASHKILDLGTGSGAIALAIAKEKPQASVFAVDSQENALAVAKKNAANLELKNVQFLQSDWFSAINEHGFDIILSNPPYVESGDPHLQQGDLRFEPDAALIGAGDGLEDIRQIVATAPDYLKADGKLLIEHGFDQALAVKEIMSRCGFIDIENHQDLNYLPRCTFGKLSE